MRDKLNIIQMLRGFAAVIVVIHHISGVCGEYFNYTLLGDVFRIGWNGVDFFFVLSGFIISFAHFNNLQSGQGVREFLIKRVVRIYPIYWLIALVSLICFLILGQLNLRQDSTYIIKSFLLIKQPNIPFLKVAWSLIYEMFFYLMFALFIKIGWQKTKIVVPVWFVAILYIAMFEPTLAQSFFFTDFILEFLLGCFVAYLFLKFAPQLKNKRHLIFCLGVMQYYSVRV